MNSSLKGAGFGLFMLGFLCMPVPVTNPEAITSLFPWLAMSGALVRYGAWSMAAGALLFALSFAFRRRE